MSGPPGPVPGQACGLTQAAAALRELAARRLVAQLQPDSTPPAPLASTSISPLGQASAASAAWAIAAAEPGDAPAGMWVRHVSHLLRKAQTRHSSGANGMNFPQEFFSRKLAVHDTSCGNIGLVEPPTN